MGCLAEIPRSQYTTTILLLFSTFAMSQAAEPERDLAALLRSQSCDKVWHDAAFSMDVLSRSFPVPHGFRFVGIERDLIVFRRTSNNSSEIMSRVHDDVQATLQEKTLSLNRELASVTYGEKRDIVLGDTGVEREVTALQWGGLDIVLWTSVGGNIVETKAYQAVVQVEGNDYQVGITSLDLGFVSSLIGCSK